jgi:hypothetical protein
MCYKKTLPIFITWMLLCTSILNAKYPYDGRQLYTAKEMIYEMPENHPFSVSISSNIPVTARIQIKPKDSGQAIWWSRYPFTPFQNHISIDSSTPPNGGEDWYVHVEVLYDHKTSRNPQVTINKYD